MFSLVKQPPTSPDENWLSQEKVWQMVYFRGMDSPVCLHCVEPRYLPPFPHPNRTMFSKPNGAPSPNSGTLEA
jgi:hypothetical protein